MGKRTERILQALEEEHGEPVFYYRMEDDVPRRKYIVLPPYDPREGKLLPPFEKLKKDPEFRKKFIDIFLEAHEMPKSRYGEKMEKYLQLAMDAAEEVAEFLGEDGKALVKPEELAQLEKLTRYLDTLMREEFYLRPVEKKAQKQTEQEQPAPKSPKKKAVEEPTVEEHEGTNRAKESGGRRDSTALLREKLEILSILNGLEFAGFSEEAKRKAVEKLSTRIAELSEGELTPENLQRLGLYAFAVEMIRRGDFERLREVEKL
ncbi:hypothetical protein [Thermococcus prieurii]